MPQVKRWVYVTSTALWIFFASICGGALVYGDFEAVTEIALILFLILSMGMATIAKPSVRCAVLAVFIRNMD